MKILKRLRCKHEWKVCLCADTSEVLYLICDKCGKIINKKYKDKIIKEWKKKHENNV